MACLSALGMHWPGVGDGTWSGLWPRDGCWDGVEVKLSHKSDAPQKICSVTRDNAWTL